jgi:hypothetical protein
MRKTLLLFLGIALFGGLLAQDAEEELKNTLAFNPMKFAESTFQLNYERMLSPNKSLNFVVGAIYHEEYDHEEGFLGELHFRYYAFQKQNPRAKFSIYFSPYFQYKYVDVSRESYDYLIGFYYDRRSIIHSFGVGVLAGFKVCLVKQLELDFYFGGGMRRTNKGTNQTDDYYYNSGVWDNSYNGIAPKVGLTAGFRF